MKRFALKLALFLLLGAILNVAVAWGCALSKPSVMFIPTAIRRLPNGTDWIVSRCGLTGTSHVVSWLPGGQFVDSANLATSNQPERLLPSWSRIRTPALPADAEFKVRNIGGTLTNSGPSQILVDEAFGLPFLCMRCGWGLPNSFAYSVRAAAPTPIVNGLELDAPNVFGDGGRALPLGFMWFGFVGNSVIYAVLLGTCPPLFVWVRGRARIRQGLCPACAYPIGASDVCTECGKVVKA